SRQTTEEIDGGLIRVTREDKQICAAKPTELVESGCILDGDAAWCFSLNRVRGSNINLRQRRLARETFIFLHRAPQVQADGPVKTYRGGIGLDIELGERLHRAAGSLP